MEKETISIYSEAGEFVGYASESAFQVIEDDGEIFVKKCFVDVESNPHDDHPSIVREGLRALYARSCTCEHDCCGHYFGGIVGDILYKAGMYEFTVKYFRNV